MYKEEPLVLGWGFIVLKLRGQLSPTKISCIETPGIICANVLSTCPQPRFRCNRLRMEGLAMLT